MIMLGRKWKRALEKLRDDYAEMRQQADERDHEFQRLLDDLDEVTRAVHVCPVCGGRGTVRDDFYNGFAIGTGNRVECRTCKGTGTVRLVSAPVVHIPSVRIDDPDAVESEVTVTTSVVDGDETDWQTHTDTADSRHAVNEAIRKSKDRSGQWGQ